MINEKYIALVGEDGAFLKDALLRESRIQRVVVLPRDETVDSPIQTHPDTILTVWQDKIYCHSEYYNKNKDLLDSILPTVACGGERGGTYPRDVAFNTLYVGDKLIARCASLASELKEFACDTKQGYAGCCGIWFGGEVISADASIIKTARSIGVQTHRISGKDIKLEGYDTGFIGGACGVLDDTVFLCGDSGESAEEIMRYCSEKGLKYTSLCSGVLTDVGGIKFIKMALQNV